MAAVVIAALSGGFAHVIATASGSQWWVSLLAALPIVALLVGLAISIVNSDGLSLWEWLLVAIIILGLLVGVYFVYKMSVSSPATRAAGPHVVRIEATELASKSSQTPSRAGKILSIFAKEIVCIRFGSVAIIQSHGKRPLSPVGLMLQKRLC
jgi:hypothetical protein